MRSFSTLTRKVIWNWEIKDFYCEKKKNKSLNLLVQYAAEMKVANRMCGC